MTPDPQVLQQIAQTPKEPDAMTVAAKAQYEKVKSETAQAMGDLQFRQQKQQQDDAFRHEKLRQDTAIAEQKVKIDAFKAHTEASAPGEPPPDNSPDFAKIAADLHKHSVDATQNAQQMQLDAETKAAELEQKRQAAELQASTALHSSAVQAETARETAAAKPSGGA
jgi:hypothetical protein